MRDKLTVLQCAHSNGEVNTLGDTTIELHDLGMNHGLGMTVFLLHEQRVAYVADIVKLPKYEHSLCMTGGLP